MNSKKLLEKINYNFRIFVKNFNQFMKKKKNVADEKYVKKKKKLI